MAKCETCGHVTPEPEKKTKLVFKTFGGPLFRILVEK
jgi:hypothetical protein